MSGRSPSEAGVKMTLDAHIPRAPSRLPLFVPALTAGSLHLVGEASLSLVPGIGTFNFSKFSELIGMMLLNVSELTFFNFQFSFSPFWVVLIKALNLHQLW